MNILSPHRYKSRRLGPLSDADIDTRATAYALKDPTNPARFTACLSAIGYFLRPPPAQTETPS